jgi:1-acyl-sn-glycerol-3-phosphate acyltransferase
MLLRILSYILCRIFFRGIHISGTPYTGKSSIWTPNHSSGIVDPAVMIGLAPVRVRPISKHTLWQIPVMRVLLWLANAIPIIRQQDLSEEEKEKFSIKELNEQAFKKVTEALIKGDNVLIFPEGVSHDEPHIFPLKTGASRMALQAVSEGLMKDEKFVVVIQPVSIDYSEKDEFRSELCIHFCTPIPVTSPDIPFKELTQSIYDSINRGIATFLSWDEKRNWRFLFEMAYGRTPSSGREFRIFVEKHRETFDKEENLMSRLQTIRRFLQVLDLSASQMVWAQSNQKKRSFLWLIMRYGWFHLLIYMPIQMIGLFVWGLPYKICDYLADLSGYTRDVKATMKIAHGLYVFPLWAFFFATLFTYITVDYLPNLSTLMTWSSFLILGPLSLGLSFFLNERINFFPGYWRLSKIRLFFPRAWSELLAEWTELSRLIDLKIQKEDGIVSLDEFKVRKELAS